MDRNEQESRVVNKLDELRRRYLEDVSLYWFIGAEYGPKIINQKLLGDLPRLRKAYRSMFKRAQDLGFNTGDLPYKIGENRNKR